MVPAPGTAAGNSWRAEGTVPIAFVMAGRLYNFKKIRPAAFASETPGNAVLSS